MTISLPEYAVAWGAAGCFDFDSDHSRALMLLEELPRGGEGYRLGRWQVASGPWQRPVAPSGDLYVLFPGDGDVIAASKARHTTWLDRARWLGDIEYAIYGMKKVTIARSALHWFFRRQHADEGLVYPLRLAALADLWNCPVPVQCASVHQLARIRGYLSAPERMPELRV